MSSVQLALYCCANSSTETDSLIEFYPFVYNGLCAAVSVLSMFGALYTILPSCQQQINRIQSADTIGDINQHSTTTYSNSDTWERSSTAGSHLMNINEPYLNHRKIIYWLTIADFLAVFGKQE